MAILIGALIGILASRDTSTEVPSVEGRSLQRAEEILEQRGFTINQPPIQVERQVEAGTVLEQDPTPSPPGHEAEEDCSFLTLFCSKPAVTLTVSIGPGEGVVPGRRRPEPAKKRRRSSKPPNSKVATEHVNSSSVEEGDVDPLRTELPATAPPTARP